MSKFISSYVNIVDTICEKIGRFVMYWVFFMMFLLILSFITRNIINFPLMWIIEIDPDWAEAWNKRATVFYLVGQYQKSQDDIEKVLNLEKRHFGALAGQGLVNIQLKNFEKAIKSYEKALEIYPSMRSPEIMIKEIEALIKQELI